MRKNCCQDSKLQNSSSLQHICCDSMLLASIEWFAVKVNDSFIASFLTCHIDTPTKLQPRNCYYRPAGIHKVILIPVWLVTIEHKIK